MIKDEKLQKIEAMDLSADINYSPGSVVSKTLVDGSGGTVTLFAFDQGQSLSKHSAPFDAAVQAVEGELELEIGERTVRLKTGRLVVMPANVPHALKAVQKTKMLLTMLKP
jgi:quercetin dioxygenase-like cupin family protein